MNFSAKGKLAAACNWADPRAPAVPHVPGGLPVAEGLRVVGGSHVPAALRASGEPRVLAGANRDTRAPARAALVAAPVAALAVALVPGDTSHSNSVTWQLSEIATCVCAAVNCARQSVVLAATVKLFTQPAFGPSNAGN